MSADLVKLDAKRVFNNNVGIYQLIDLDHDEQLGKAIRIIENGEVQKLISSKIAGSTADLYISSLGTVNIFLLGLSK